MSLRGVDLQLNLAGQLLHKGRHVSPVPYFREQALQLQPEIACLHHLRQRYAVPIGRLEDLQGGVIPFRPSQAGTFPVLS